ncbi:YaiI/YqxD family protein [Enterococcus dongliensis]|uniref:YaiI/YqxD family protein n=1 Tax=Enterococcus dongliensis TaxID=2559925 RepID=UPI00288EDB75|nr:YaiI/YqxD family protein [Enterococcus dongliensis]MDT2640010.1 YaiI/YqxD family protein [Enterococcus dongliensis]
MRLIIDGDGSPVKDTTILVAEKYGIPVVIVTSIDHYSKKEYPDFVRFIYVDRGSDSADFKIISVIKPTDILITQDYGLASLTLAKAAHVLHQTGMEYTQMNIDALLTQRFIGSKMRQAKQRTKGPKPFTNVEREQFKEVLESLIQQSLV